MRTKNILGSLVLLLAVAACVDSTDPSSGNTTTHPFFPYSAGDEYTMIITEKASDTVYTRRWSVTSVMINGQSYQRHVSDPYLHEDVQAGLIAFRSDTELYHVEGSAVYFSASVTQPAQLYLAFDSIYSDEPKPYFSYVRDTAGIVTDAGTFNGKIMRKNTEYFEVATHVCSEKVGTVYTDFYSWETRLASARIGGRHYP